MDRRRAEGLRQIASKLHRIASAIDEEADEAMKSSGGSWDDPAVSRTDQEKGVSDVPESSLNPKDEGDILDLIESDSSAIGDEPSPADGMNKGLSKDNRFRSLKKDTFSSRSSDKGSV